MGDQTNRFMKFENPINQANRYKPFLDKIYKSADFYTEVLLILNYAFGTFLAFFYETWLMGFGVGALNLLLYYAAKFSFPRRHIHHYVAAWVYGLFMAQFIYQMHGLFEMHFFAFIGAIALVMYQNWKLQIPMATFVVVHHGVFAWLQYSGMEEIYFTQLEYMGLTTYIFHVSLAGVIFVLCGYTAFDLRRRTLTGVSTIIQKNDQLDVVERNKKFAESMAKGDLECDVEIDTDDGLGSALVEMRNNLRVASEKEAEEKFATQGLAEVSDLLRQTDSTKEAIADRVLSYLVDYMGANQGGIYMAEENEEGNTYLKLVAAYAYSKKKYREHELEPGETLVGQTFIEQETTYLTNIPQDYVYVTSGLGEATPGHLVVSPLKVNEKIEGVIEIASFDPLQQYKINFIERVGEIIATTFASTRVTEQTRLLLEESRQREEMLRMQEEEMRQNNEEMQATQEEMKRKEAELNGYIEGIDQALATVEFDTQGRIKDANSIFIQTIGYTLEDLKRKEHFELIPDDEFSREEYDAFWDKLRAGETLSGVFRRSSRSGEDVWLQASYAPIRDTSGATVKVIKFAHDITQQVRESQKVKLLSLVANESSSAVVITDQDGYTEYVNRGFEQLTGYSLNEVKGRKPGSVLQGPDTDQATVQRIKQKLLEQESFYEEILNYHKNGSTYWISLNINPVFDSHGELIKYVAMQANITETKNHSLNYRYRMEAIQRSNAVVEMDMNYKINSANDQFVNDLGVEHDHVKGLSLEKLFTPQTLEELESNQVWNVMNNDGFYKGEFSFISKEGKSVWLRGSLDVIYDVNRKPISIILLGQNVTLEKELALEAEKQNRELQEKQQKLKKYTAELEDLQQNISQRLKEAKDEMKDHIAALEQEKEKNVTILEGCVDGVISINDHGNIDFMNAAAEEIWGVARSEVMGRSINHLLPIALDINEQGEIRGVFIGQDDHKISVGVRTEVNFTNREDEDVTVLLTQTTSRVSDGYSITFFAQKISVDLF